jgi:superfamily II DNA or RNA helicase
MIKTGFKPEVEMAQNGKINWNSIIDQQALNQDRNELIINIVKLFPDRTFLILVKRIEQGEYLVTRFKQEGENVTSLLGKQQIYDKDSRILVGTTGKTSCGFDHDKLDALILGADIVSYYIQALGRVLRTEILIPLIFDLVDDNGILLKHSRNRKSIYLEHGGTIKDFRKEFPDFNIITDKSPIKEKKVIKDKPLKRLLHK